MSAKHLPARYLARRPTWPPNRPRARRPSGRRPTSTRWAPSCTNVSPRGRHSRRRLRLTPSCRWSATSRCRHVSSTPGCRWTWRRLSSSAFRKTQPGATTAPRNWLTTWAASWSANLSRRGRWVGASEPGGRAGATRSWLACWLSCFCCWWRGRSSRLSLPSGQPTRRGSPRKRRMRPTSSGVKP